MNTAALVGELLLLTAITCAIITAIALIVRLVMRAKGVTYRPYTAALPTAGEFTHYTLDRVVEAIDNADGTVTLMPHRTLGTLHCSVYLYGPAATHRGTHYNHGFGKPGRPVWTEIRIPATALAALAPGGRIRWRPWDDAYALVCKESISVPATVTRGLSLAEAKQRQGRGVAQ